MHGIKPAGYVRYGDDFVIVDMQRDRIASARECVTTLLNDLLLLSVNAKNDVVIKCRWGLHFLGTHIFPGGRRLNARNIRRINHNLTPENAASYRGLLQKHASVVPLKFLDWKLIEQLEEYM